MSDSSSEYTLEIQLTSSLSLSQFDDYLWDLGDSAFIFNYALSDTWDVFSAVEEMGLEAAGEALYEYNYHHSLNNQLVVVDLLFHPCMDQSQQGSDGCNEICGNKEKLFDEWETLLSCLALASLSFASDIFRNGTNSRVILDAIDTAMDGLSMGNITDFNGKQVLRHTLSCVTASCAVDKSYFCDTNFEDRAEQFFSGKVGNWSFLDGKYCDGIVGTVNVDLAGPGVSRPSSTINSRDYFLTTSEASTIDIFEQVFLSYQIQAWLALAIWVVIRILSLATTFRHINRVFRREGFQIGESFSTAFLHAETFLKRIADSNICHATASLVADFHEAQCFLVAATSIAIIRARDTGSAQFAGSKNWASLNINESLAAGLGVRGIFSVILTQLILQRLSMDSVYSLLCATLASILAAVQTSQQQTFTATRVHQLFDNDGQGLDECGNNPPLTAFCGSEFSGTFGARETNFATVWSIMASSLTLLWCYKIGPSLVKLEGIQRKIWRIKMGDSVDFRTPEGAVIAAKLFVWIGFTAFQILLAMLLIVNGAYNHDLYWGSATWNVGQVIAVLIWAPIFAKYLYTLICKSTIFFLFSNIGLGLTLRDSLGQLA